MGKGVPGVILIIMIVIQIGTDIWGFSVWFVLAQFDCVGAELRLLIRVLGGPRSHVLSISEPGGQRARAADIYP